MQIFLQNSTQKWLWKQKILLLTQSKVSKAIYRLLSEELDEGQKPYGFYLVAVTEDQTPVGCMMLTYEINPSIGGLCMMIQSVFVEKEYRKEGIFRMLFEKAKEIAKADKSCKCLRLYVETENEVAQKVYQKMGMNQVDFSFMEKDFVFPH